MNKRNFFIKTAFFLLLIFLITACKTSSEKLVDTQKEKWNTNYTFVFVHGLSGWGHYDARNKFFPYWGMKNGSLIKKLNKEGFCAYDASVAPHGSAWDRACELYAQLTGSITDYGAEHSARCGHPRYGRDFSKEPLIPQWDEKHKINILGHSFGGVTVRLLAHLMAEGSLAEQEATPADELCPLFAGSHSDWIYSVTTLAAPHNGTSAYHIPDEETKTKSWIQKNVEKSYAPKKDGRADYDYADFDMHIQNADKINSWLKTIPEAYYFSFACSATLPAEDGSQVPDPKKMEKIFQKTAAKLGRFEGLTPDGIELGKEWQENDGLVNTISARAPGHSPSKEFSENEKIEKGIWYIMPVYDGDHMSMQGGFSVKKDITAFYINHLNLINSLR